MTSSSSHKRQEMCVAGWLRENRGNCPIPDALLYIIQLMYVLRKDKWEKGRCDEEIEITKYGFQVGLTWMSSNYWSNAYGKMEIKKGECHVWRFRMCANSDDSIFLFIGIVPSDCAKVKSNKRDFLGQGNVAYAIQGWNGKKYYADGMSRPSPGLDYASPIRNKDIVEMKLDMTESKTKGLSFKINDNDYGIASDDFDMDRSYCMAVAILQSQTSIEMMDPF